MKPCLCNYTLTNLSSLLEPLPCTCKGFSKANCPTCTPGWSSMHARCTSTAMVEPLRTPSGLEKPLLLSPRCEAPLILPPLLLDVFWLRGKDKKEKCDFLVVKTTAPRGVLPGTLVFPSWFLELKLSEKTCFYFQNYEPQASFSCSECSNFFCIECRHAALVLGRMQNADVSVHSGADRWEREYANKQSLRKCTAFCVLTNSSLDPLLFQQQQLITQDKKKN